jgi:hypothetical protein
LSLKGLVGHPIAALPPPFVASIASNRPTSNEYGPLQMGALTHRFTRQGFSTSLLVDAANVVKLSELLRR